MNNNEKIKSIIDTHKQEIVRLEELLKKDLAPSSKKAVATQLLHSKKAVSRLTGRLEKQGILITQSLDKKPIKRTRKVKQNLSD